MDGQEFDKLDKRWRRDRQVGPRDGQELDKSDKRRRSSKDKS